MVSAEEHSTLSVGLVKILESYADSLEVDFHAAAKACGLDTGIVSDGEARIPVRQFVSLWLRIAAMGDDSYPGLNFGRQAAEHYPAGSILFSLMRNCATIRQALDVFVRYHRIMADAIRPLCRQDGGVMRLTWDMSAIEEQMPPYLCEAVLCCYYMLFSKLTQGKIRPEKICFTHQGPDSPEDLKAYFDVFNGSVFFNQEHNELILGTRNLDIKIDLPNASLYQILEPHADRLLAAMPPGKPLSSEVFQLITDGIFSGSVPDMDEIAKTLARSRRSLQEKLKKEGSRFRDLLQAARKQVALNFLSRQDASVCEVAFMLGYSDQSAFTHAFRRWTGQSPKDIRKRFIQTAKIHTGKPVIFKG